MSASLIRQSAMRESTISIAAATPAIAGATSVGVIPGPCSREPSTNTISASTLGAMKRSSGIASPSR